MSHSWGWQQQVEVEKLIGRVPAEIRTPPEAAEHFGVQVGQVQLFVMIAEIDGLKCL